MAHYFDRWAGGASPAVRAKVSLVVLGRSLSLSLSLSHYSLGVNFPY
jgi:hypothetical protein